MTGLERLRSAFEAFAAGRATPEQDSAIRAAIAAGDVQIVTGERAAQIGRDANGATIITGDKNIILSVGAGELATLLKAWAAERRRVDHLPADLPDFEGREAEIEKLCTALRDGGQAAITAIGGMGGVGKSALAVHVAHRVASDIAADGVLYIELGGVSERPLTAVDAIADVIATFDPTAPKPTNEHEAVAGFRAALYDKQILLVLDNAKDAGTVVPLFEHRPPRCTILVTSRETIVWPGVTPVPLEEMTRDEARKLLRAIVGMGRATDGQLDEIARHCGCLPLALRVAGSFLSRHPNWPVRDYLNALADERGRLEKLRLRGMPKLDVAAVLGFSARQLAGEDRALAERWQALSVFVESFDLLAVAAVWGLSTNDALEGLGELVARSMVRFDPESSRYRLHDLMRDVAQVPLENQGRAALDAMLEAARARHALHYRTTLATAGALYRKGADSVLAGLALYDLEQRHIAAGQAWAATRIEQEVAARVAAEYADAGAYVLALRLHPREWIGWLEAARKACIRLEERGSEGALLGNLGNAWFTLGEPRQAIDYHKQALTIFREIGDRQGEGNALSSLGIAHRYLGDPRRAIGYHERALSICREIGDRRGEGTVLGNLGSDWYSLGEPRRAIEHYEQDLEIAREVGNRRGEGNALGNLGNAWMALGARRRAIEFYNWQLTITREIGDRIGEGTALFNSALALDRLDERAEAVRQARAALAIFKAIGARHLVEKARAQLAEWGANKAPG